MRCHYAVLGVARGATEDDIRKAYRKLVIALHPDKAQQRGEDPQKATEAFREVQAAYECLYDDQERAYYDANRDAILRGEDPDEYEVEPPTPQKKKRGRAKRDAEDVWDAFEAELWPFFSREAFAEFDDSESEQVIVTEDSLTKTMARIMLVGVQSLQRLAPFLNFLWVPLERFCVRAATTTTTTPPGFFPCYRDAFERVLLAVGAGAYDVVHNNSLFPEIIEWCARAGIPCVTSQHVPPFGTMFDAVVATCKEPHIGFTVTSHDQRSLWADRGCPELDVVPNGIDTDRWVPQGEPQDYLTWVGRIVPNKGLAEAIQAARTGRRRRERARSRRRKAAPNWCVRTRTRGDAGAASRRGCRRSRPAL